MTVAPFGTWKSSISATLIASDSVGLSEPSLEGDDCYWLENRAAEGGRCVLVRCGEDGGAIDVTPAGYNVRTRVHEYGGGAYIVSNATTYFVNFADQRVYCQARDKAPIPVTPPAALRYADFAVDRARQRLIAVREDHRDDDSKPINTLVALDCTSEQRNAAGGQILASGDDFYSSPRLSPDGKQLVWLSWNHPNMPWDSTTLWLAQIASDGTLHDRRRIAGSATESVCQPAWSPDGALHFISDRNGWWNLYLWQHNHGRALCEKSADFCSPPWVFGLSNYAFLDAETILCTYAEDSAWRLARLLRLTGILSPVKTTYTEFGGLRTAGGRLVCCAGAPHLDTAIVRVDPESGQTFVLRRSTQNAFDAGVLTVPQAITFPSARGRAAHALYYAPRNDDYVAPTGELPPLIVRGHGGPTAMASTALSLGIQYWTSRGWAVLDVNYTGSSGFGRAYREGLYGEWGIADVEDCVYAARYLVAQGKADAERLAIRGGSAGGYTALCALTFHDTFKAGASLYGISDLEALAKDTHKFESRYLERLIGLYPSRRDLYYARSPLHFVDQLNAPTIFFHGSEDKVVPPTQAQQLVDALRNKGLPVAYLLFESEGHGFRQATNIARALEAELFFYGKVFDFAPADKLSPVVIDNIKKLAPAHL